MAVTLENFVEQLENSGILARDALQEFIPPRAAPKTAEELARELVRQKKLTRFQAELLWQGKGKSLVLGNYVLLEKIGQGGMGAVYKAEHRRMKRSVAIKMLPPEMLKNAAAAARFQREVEAAAKLRHPNIVAADDADCANGVHFLVMELVEGSDLAVMVQKHGPLPIPQAVNCILQAARGLEFAHHEGIVHRDIKPANLLLDKKGTVKILDMGLARLNGQGDVPHQAGLTSSGMIMGTVDYMAPEQAVDTKSADARADIYSLGCSLFYLLTGTSTYSGDSLMSRLLAHRDNPIPALRAFRPEVPEQIEKIFQKMVAKRADDRYQAMADVVFDLEQSLAGHTGSLSLQQAMTSKNEDPALSFLKELPPQAGYKPKPASTAVQRKTAKDRQKLVFMGAIALGVSLLVGLVVWLGTGAPKVATKPRGTQPPAEKPAIETPPEPMDSLIPPWKRPDFLKWQQEVAALLPVGQVEAVHQKLAELNPGFAPKPNNYELLDDQIIGLNLRLISRLSDISPVRALTKLKSLNVNACRGVTDISPLEGMSLISLDVSLTRVSDVSSLQGMPLERLYLSGTAVSDLAPLQGMPLKALSVSHDVTDLTPLTGMKLEEFTSDLSNLRDVSPLSGMPLTKFKCNRTRVSDLSPLEGMPLVSLNCFGSPVSDLSPLSACKTLTDLELSNTEANDETARQLQGLSNLGTLKLMKTGISDIGLKSLESLTSLKTLDLSETQVTSAGVTALKKALPDCNIQWDDPAKATTP